MHIIAMDRSRGHARAVALHQHACRSGRPDVTDLLQYRNGGVSERGFLAARRSRSSAPLSIHNPISFTASRFLKILEINR